MLSKSLDLTATFLKQLALASMVFVGLSTTSCSNEGNSGQTSQTQTSVETLSYKVVNRHPHRRDAYTQGLLLENGLLYESTGLYGKSDLSIMAFPSDKILQQHQLAEQYFGEGLTKIDDQLIQLTWRSGKVFRYHAKTLTLLQQQTIENEGWGITTYQGHLITSDGSNILTFRDIKTLRPERKLSVELNGKPIAKLNELETLENLIAANIYQSDKIVFISAETGQIQGILDLSALTNHERQLGRVDVLNGIAYDASSGNLLVTGKLWHYIYEISVETELF